MTPSDDRQYVRCSSGTEGEKRFGFQSQEKDEEVSGYGNSYAFEYRMHDPRVGRFLSLDPLSASFPWNAPYVFAENRAIDCIDLEGLESFQISTKEIHRFNPETQQEEPAGSRLSLVLTDPKAKFEVIDEDGVRLNNFKYCSFICQMRGFDVDDLTGGTNTRVPEYEIDVPNLNSGPGKFGVSNFELTAPINDPEGVFKVNSEWSGYFEDIDEPSDVWSGVTKLYYITGLSSDERTTLAKRRSAEFGSFDTIRIYNGSEFTDDQIRNEIVNTVWYRPDMDLQFIPIPPSEGAGSKVTIEYGSTQCEGCD